MIFRALILAALFATAAEAQTQAPKLNPVPGDPGDETPATRRSIPLKLGSADVVQGALDLKVPLGPTLPGRVPLSFAWTFNGHSGLNMNLGGDFRPVTWPSSSTRRLSFPVLVNGESLSFPTNYHVTSNFDPAAIMVERGIDDGRAEAVAAVQANNANINNVAVILGPFVWEAYTNEDESAYFIRTSWKLVHQLNPSDYSNWYVGNRMFVLKGNTVIWTDGKGTNHFMTTWGDHVTATETGLTYANPYPDALVGGSIVLKNENHPDQTITLTVKYNSLDVTNTLGLPSVHMPGSFAYTQRSMFDELGQLVATPERLYDMGFLPDSMQVQTQGEAGPVTTTFTWTPNVIGGSGGPVMTDGKTPPLKSITHPDGLVESFTYGSVPAKRASDYAFDARVGTWVGFNPKFNWLFGTLQYYPLSKITKVDVDGKGSTVVINRVVPDWTDGAAFSWLQTDHTTTVQVYPTPDGTGPSRQVKLTHPSYAGPAGGPAIWGDPATSSEGDAKAAYLFATAAVVQTDLYDESGTLYHTARFNGWDFHSKLNQAGTILQNGSSVTTPMLANATGAIFTAPNLPIQSRVLQNWQDVAFTSRHAGNDSADAALPLVTGAYGASSTVVSTTLDQATTTTLSFKANHTWQPQTVSKVLSGSQLPLLRSGAGNSLTLESASYVYDSLTRVTGVTTTLGTGITQEARTYQGNNPEPTEVSQWAGFGADSATAIGLNFAGLTGKTYTYSPAPDFWRLGEFDKLTGVGNTYERDSLGRVKKATDLNGVVTTTSYDGWGRVEYEIRLAAGGVGAVSKHHSYDPNGTWSQVDTTAEGKTVTTKTYYDGFGRTIKEVAADGGVRTTSYNGYGEKTSESPWLRPGQTPYGNTTFTYDGKGRLTTTKDPQGRVLSSASLDPHWDATAGGVTATVVDDRGFSRTTVTDLLGQKKALTDPKGQVSTFAYDTYGRMASMTLNGQVRSYTYDDLGHMTSRTEPEEGRTEYGYFTMWGVPARSTRLGTTGTEWAVVDTIFDGLGRPSQVFDHAPGTFVRSLAYDLAFPTRITTLEESQADGYVREDYAYDALGRMTGKAILDDQLQSFSMSRSLDAMGNVTSMTYPGLNGSTGASLLIGYDSFFRPATITKGGQTRAVMTYDQVVGTTVSQTLAFGNAASTLRSFDKGELTMIQHSGATGMLESNPMTWTAGGLLLKRGSDAFDYDELGRLKSASTTGLSGEVHAQAFTYDAWGNRTRNQVATQLNAQGAGVIPEESLSWTAAYAEDNHLPATVFAPNNAPLSTGVAYDAFGRLQQVWAIPGQPSSLTSWIYDANGRITMENGTRFLLDGQGLRFRRTKPDGSVQYTVYGFNRDPLSTFEAAAPTPVAASFAKASGAKTSGQKPQAMAVTRAYGKLESVHTEVKALKQYTKSLAPSQPAVAAKKTMPTTSLRKVETERPSPSH